MTKEEKLKPQKCPNDDAYICRKCKRHFAILDSDKVYGYCPYCMDYRKKVNWISTSGFIPC